MHGAVDGKEVEVLMAGWDGSRFETFCNALLLSNAPTPLKRFPRLTDHSNSADGGIDAEFFFEGDDVTPLLSPGRNVFQFKWRSPYEPKQALRSILSKLKKEFERHNHSDSVARYTLVTNLNLTGKQQAAVTQELRQLAPGTEISVLAAGGLAALINGNPYLKATFLPGELYSWVDKQEQHSRLTDGLPAFQGRARELAELDNWLQDDQSRVMVVSGLAGIGKSRLVIEATRPHQPRVVFLTAESGLNGLSGLDIFAVVDDLPMQDVERWVNLGLAQLTKAKMILITRSPGILVPDARCRHLSLGPLSAGDSAKLLESREASLSLGQSAWLLSQSGGYPLSLVLASRLGPKDFDNSRTIYENLSQSWKSEVQRAIGEDGWLALRLASLLVAVSGDPDEAELEALAEALGHPSRGLSAFLPRLEKLGCLEPLGRLRRVQPNFLAEILCEQLLGSGHQILLSVLARLSAPAAARFLERILSLGTPGGSALRQALIAPDGPWAEKIDERRLVRLAESEPEAVLKFVIENKRKASLLCFHRLLAHKATARESMQLLHDQIVHGSDPRCEDLFLVQFYPEWPTPLGLDERLFHLRSISEARLLWRGLAASFCVSGLLIYEQPWRSSPPALAVPSEAEKQSHRSEVVELAFERFPELPPEIYPTALYFLREACAYVGAGRGVESLSILVQKARFKPNYPMLLLATIERFSKAFPEESGFTILKEAVESDPLTTLEAWLDNHKLVEYKSYEEWMGGRQQAFAEVARNFADKPSLLTAELAERLASKPEGRLFLEHLGQACPNLLAQIPLEGVPAFISSVDPILFRRQVLENDKMWRSPARPVLLETMARHPAEDWSQAFLVEKATDPSLPVKELRAAGFWRWPLEPAPWIEAVEKRPELSGWLLELLFAKEIPPHTKHLAWKCLASKPPPWLGNHLTRMQVQMVAARLVPEDPARGIEIFLRGLEAGRRMDGKLPLRHVDEPFFQALVKAAPAEFLDRLFELAAENQFSLFHFSQEMRDSLGREQQHLLLDQARRHRERAATVALCLHPENPEFWQACQELLEIAAGDTQVEASLFAALTRSGESYWGSETARLRGFLDQIATPLESHPSSLVRRWLTNAKRGLDDDLQRKLVWEYDLKSREFERSLAASGTAAQKWAVKRLVENGQFQDVRRLVGPDLLARYLPDLDLPPNRKKALEKALEFWMQDVG